MCGVTGFWQVPEFPEAVLCERVRYMADTMFHRGPDDSGTWVDKNVGIALGFRRLAILDLSPSGHQPMHSANGRYVVVFNGEIYNYLELRAEQERSGAQFRGTSDTEVILECFLRWGVEGTLSQILGMFAIALWDRETRTLTLARDRMGEKPLYYGWVGSAFLFSSELKGLRAHPQWRGEIDRNVLALYFRYNYVPAPYSIYTGIYKLLPGTCLKLETAQLKTGVLPEPSPYWSLRSVAESGAREPFHGTDEEAITQLDMLLRSSVAGQMVSDVPLGAFLSGGVDSSTIVALMQAQSSCPVKTFTIGFDDLAYNEAVHARAVAQHLGTDHTELYVTAQDTLNVVPRLPMLYDEPFADSSQIPMFLVAQLARQHVTVSLSGDGGDEVFCGYNRHVQLTRLWNRIEPIPLLLRKALASIIHSVPSALFEQVLWRRKNGVLGDQVQKLSTILGLNDPESMYLRLTHFWDRPSDLVLNSVEPQTLLSIQEQWPQLQSYLELLLYLESATSLPDDMLVKVDRAAMGVSLETRMPLLDHRVVEFAWRLPLKMKLRDSVGKWLLRQVLYQYVPQSLIDRPKSGFAIPIDMWLKGPMRDWAEDLLDESRVQQEGFLDSALVQQKWRQHVSGRRKWQYHLWSVLMFEAWLECQKSGAR